MKHTDDFKLRGGSYVGLWLALSASVTNEKAKKRMAAYGTSKYLDIKKKIHGKELFFKLTLPANV